MLLMMYVCVYLNAVKFTQIMAGLKLVRMKLSWKIYHDESQTSSQFQVL